MNEELLKMLKDLAARNCWSDNPDFNADDYSGGNFDDAYNGGYEDGQAKLAQSILAKLGQ